MNNLNEINVGTRLQFNLAPDGVVVERWTEILDGDGDRIESRLRIKHINHTESYHTYRRDGRSHQDPHNDIIAVFNDCEDEMLSLADQFYQQCYEYDKEVNR